MTDAASTHAKSTLFTRQFIVAALMNFAMFVSFQMTTAGMPVYLQHLGATDLQISLTVTLVTGAAIVVRPFAGYLLDSFGHKGALLGGLLIMLVVTVAYVVFPLIGIILGFRLIHGIGWGLGATASSTIVAGILPKERFAEGMGWFSLGNALGIAIGPALAIFLIGSVSATAMVAVAAIALAIALALSLLIEPSREPRTRASLRDALHVHALFEARALLPAGQILLFNIGIASVNTFIAVYGIARGVDSIALYFVVNAITSMLTRPFLGRFVDARGMFVPGILATLCMAATLVIVGCADSVALFCVAGVFAGLAAGMAMCVFQTMAVASVPLDRKGVATSTYMVGFDGGMCIGSIVAGVVATALGYSSMFFVMAVFPILALILFVSTYASWKARTDRAS